MINDADKAAYLLKRGWIEMKRPHAWRWRRPPQLALFLLGDAYDLQVALDAERSKSKKLKQVTPVT